VTEQQEPQQEGDKKNQRSQRPSKPLTHQMSRKALQDAYYKAGLFRPELTKRHNETKTPERIRDKKIEPINGHQHHIEQEKTRMDGQQQTQKPGVGGTKHTSQVDGDVGPGTNALIYGGTTFGVGVMLMLAWKGLSKWLG